MVTTMQDIQVQQQELDQLAAAQGITPAPLNEMSRMVTIYLRETGEPRDMPMLAAKVALLKRFRRKHPLAGQFLFSATPTKEYHWGKSPCLLHPSNPNREQYDRWGLPVCDAARLASPGEVQKHMKSRHPTALGIIQEAEKELQRQKDIAAQASLGESILKAITQLADKPVAQPVAQALVVVACPDCTETFSAKNKLGASARLKAHRRRAHGGK
mgnify:CR=1 FL=1